MQLEIDNRHVDRHRADHLKGVYGIASDAGDVAAKLVEEIFD
jgi:hypothetical protein